MLPGYRYMDSYPQPHHFSCFPTWDDAWKQNPRGLGHWSEYPSPMEYHNHNHNHNQFYYPYCPPSYYPMRPPYSNLPPSPYFPYPPCGDGFYPPPYHAPLRYPVEHSVYDRDKGKERHCCGCPNHVCKEKEEKGGERIEEEKGNKESSLANRYPYPMVWCPPEYLKEKANDKPSEREQEKWNGWYPPFHLMNGKPQEDEKSGTVRDHGNDKKPEIPFPFFLIPGFDKLKELKNDEPKEADTSPKPVEEQPAKLKIIPVNPSGNGDHVKKPQSVEETQGNKMIKDAKGNSAKENHVKQTEENEKKSAESSSPKKSSKLPPVCLRVDPLRRRKNGSEKSSSRSPSPPGEKLKESKTTSSSGPVEQVASVKKTEEEKKVREIEVKEAKDEVSLSKEEAIEGTEAPNKAEEKPMKKQFSTTEAAVLIQSLYRGHDVRKWEPLEKLRQIARVREQVNEVRKKMQALESSVEMQKEGKQRVLISESIMSLLLQLDTIQGLHPTVREIRKAVAKELVCLQERLDSLAPTNAGGETKNEVIHSTEDCVQQDAGDLHELSRPLVNVKEIQNESSVEKQQSDEVAKEFTKSEAHVECINESCTSQTPVCKDNVETNAVVLENVQKMNGAQGDAVEETNDPGAQGVDAVQEMNLAPGDGVKEPIESSFVVDGKVGSDIEEPAEASKEDGSYEMISGDELGALQGIESVMQNTHEPGEVHVENELLPEAVDMREDHVVQELPVEDADLTQTGTENVVQESTHGVAAISDHEAEHSTEELSHGSIDGNQLDANDVHQESQQGVSSAEIIELQELQPRGLPGALDASVVDHKQVQEDAQALAPGAVPYPEIPNADANEEHGLKVLDGMPTHEIVGSDPTRKDYGMGDVWQDESLLIPETDNGPRKELVHEKAPCPCDAHIGIVHTISTDDVAVCQDEGKKTIAMNENVVSDSNIYEAEVDATNINLHESTDCKDSCLGSIEDEQEVNMKEVEVTPTNNPLRVEAEDRKLLEENEKLREMIGKLLNEGKQQMTAISDLHGRVKDLERKLTKKKKLKMRSQRPRKQALLSELGG